MSVGFGVAGVNARGVMAEGCSCGRVHGLLRGVVRAVPGVACVWCQLGVRGFEYEAE